VGADETTIDNLVPSSAVKGQAFLGGPRWTWVDENGLTWEIRYHPEANPDPRFAGGPSGAGPTIKVGAQIVPGSGLLPADLLNATDQALVKQYGIPEGVRAVAGRYYVDRFGFAYFNQRGMLAALATDETHIPGVGNPWGR
jgi:hypothetical protein